MNWKLVVLTLAALFGRLGATVEFQCIGYGSSAPYFDLFKMNHNNPSKSVVFKCSGECSCGFNELSKEEVEADKLSPPFSFVQKCRDNMKTLCEEGFVEISKDFQFFDNLINSPGTTADKKAQYEGYKNFLEANKKENHTEINTGAGAAGLLI